MHHEIAENRPLLVGELRNVLVLGAGASAHSEADLSINLGPRQLWDMPCIPLGKYFSFSHHIVRSLDLISC